jgi:2-hydroxychromene-2-carboxylate isomerase
VIEVFFDVSSPWTYLAFHRLQQTPPEVRARIVWKPILVGGVFNTVNPSVYASRERPIPAKARYMLKDLQDWARLYGLTIKMPPTVFPVNSVKVMRACVFLEPEGKLVDFARAAFEAYWSRDEDISDDTVIASLCARADIDVARLSQGISQDEVKARLRINNDDLIARGGFGSPTLFVDGDDMYFGNDRLDLALGSLVEPWGIEPQTSSLRM